jgi:hypothetical protein
MSNQSPVPQGNILVCQIIAAALMMGVVGFGGVVFVLHALQESPAEAQDVADPPREDAPPEESLPILLLVLLVLTGGCLIGRFVILGTFDRQLISDLSMDRDPPLRTEDCLGRYQTRLIISLAMLEGCAFFALIVFMVEGRWEAIGLAGFLLLIMALNFPTESKFVQWVETARISSGNPRGE